MMSNASEITPVESLAGSRSRTDQALMAIRALILEGGQDGSLAPGDRVSELSVAETTGISRTPIRAALQRLEEEGLVEAIPSGGYAVKSFSEQDVFDAIEIRGTLEGLAARFAAERGPSPSRLEPLRECVTELDKVVPDSLATEEGFAQYVALNERLHALILDLADSPALARQMERAVALPFASPSAFIIAQSHLAEARQLLVVAHDQHRCAIEAIANRQGARAEAIMQEHARLAARNLRLALKSEAALNTIPGGALIRTRR